MIIAQVSDTHIAFDAEDAEQRLRDFQAAIDDINALDPAPDVIVHTGDIVHNGRADEYAQAAAILAGARAPVYVMAGNKDSRENLRAAFSAGGYLPPSPGFIDYAVETFPVRLIMLDTLNPGSNKGDFCSDRLTRLAALTDAETTRPIAVFTHHPPFEVMVGPDRLHFESMEIMQGLALGLQRSGRVTALFAGHVHRSTVGRVGTIPAAVMPSIATSLRKGDYGDKIKRLPVYHLHRFNSDWGFSTEARIASMDIGR